MYMFSTLSKTFGIAGRDLRNNHEKEILEMI